ncbi:cupin domain-containing protein [Rubrivirga sp. IMCC43871]|uniref:cupin domain-containing protein n=1 Tax=Rubrivirga sp. IMCC43871 TaxID=3391575 RepID=UPI0039902B05
MRIIERRAFLGTALAGTLAACAPLPDASRVRSAPRLTAHVRAGQDRTGRPRVVFGGLRLDTKVAPSDSGGDLYVIEHADAHQGGPPRHVHHDQDELFYVLEGAYRLHVGEAVFDLGPGDSVFAPRGVPHVWAHVGDGVGRMLLAFQPAGRMERFFEGLASLGPAPTPATMGPLFAAHGMTLLGPPLDLG